MCGPLGCCNNANMSLRAVSQGSKCSNNLGASHALRSHAMHNDCVALPLTIGLGNILTHCVLLYRASIVLALILKAWTGEALAYLRPATIVCCSQSKCKHDVVCIPPPKVLILAVATEDRAEQGDQPDAVHTSGQLSGGCGHRPTSNTTVFHAAS